MGVSGGSVKVIYKHLGSLPSTCTKVYIPCIHVNRYMKMYEYVCMFMCAWIYRCMCVYVWFLLITYVCTDAVVGGAASERPIAWRSEDQEVKLLPQDLFRRRPVCIELAVASIAGRCMMCACMYVCMFVYVVCISMCLRVCTCMHLWMYVDYTLKSLYGSHTASVRSSLMCVNIFAYMYCMDVCAYRCTYACMYVSIRICTHKVRLFLKYFSE